MFLLICSYKNFIWLFTAHVLMHLLIEASLNLKKYDGKGFMCLLIRFITTSSEAIYCTCLMHVWIEASFNLKFIMAKIS